MASTSDTAQQQSLNCAVPLCVQDYESQAKSKLPKKYFDFYNGGSGELQTLRDNTEAFRRYRLKNKVLCDVSQRDLSVKVFNTELPFPIAVAPYAFHQLAHPDGEVATAKGAGALHALMVLACCSTKSMEDVSQAVPSGSPLWFQLYMMQDRNVTKGLVEKAEKCGYQALVVTVDAPYLGKSYQNERNQFILPTNMGCVNYKDLMPSKGDPTTDFINVCSGIFNPAITWADIDWLATITKLPIILKGILTASDACLAVKHNVAGIVVSNHGGRMLDGVQATIDALPEVAEAVRGSKVELIVDGGVRTGTDVLKALALGAKMVFVGRPALYGLASNGDAGVKHVLEILRDELSMAMAFTGCTNVSEITSDILIKK